MEQTLYDRFAELGLDYTVAEHEPFFTCAESAEFYESSPGAHCKTLFLRNRKGTKHFLAVVESHKQVDLKALTEFLGETQKMSFASPERLDRFLGLTPGSVTPFGLIHPNASDLPVLIDESLSSHDFVHFHPLRNTATVRMSCSDFFQFLKHLPNGVRSYQF